MFTHVLFWITLLLFALILSNYSTNCMRKELSPSFVFPEASRTRLMVNDTQYKSLGFHLCFQLDREKFDHRTEYKTESLVLGPLVAVDLLWLLLLGSTSKCFSIAFP